jgi:hypothetical protein
MRVRLAFLGAMFVVASTARGAVLFELHGILSASGVNVESQPSWMEGGFGRFDVGADAANRSRTAGLAFAQIGADAYLTNWLSLHANTVARAEPGHGRGRRAGVIEAYADVTPIETGRHRLRLRGGMFFLPTSRENVGPMWSSPYTITFSAWNTWIAQELRPIGAELEYRNTDAANRQLSFAAGAFEGNDTSGTLLAWRGWAMGSRMTTYSEVLPLPPLFSLTDPALFGGRQRADGTKPFGEDLDGRIGWTARVRWQIPRRFTIQLAAVDNRGDRELYRGEYAWYTEFLLLGADLHLTDRSTIAAEVAKGETAMGVLTRPHVEAGFYTAYVLFSQELGKHRISVRAETFQNDERDQSTAEDDSEHGSAVTLAYFFTPRNHLRLGAELVKLSAQRPAAAQSGADPDTGGRTFTVEARWSW